MKKLVKISVCLGSVLALGRCSPIAPSASKTLIHAALSHPDSSNTTSVGSVGTENSLRNTPGKTFFAYAKLLDKNAGAQLLSQFEETKPKAAPESLSLSADQLKDLRENKRAKLQLSFAPNPEMGVFFQVSGLATAPSGIAEKDSSPAVEVHFKALANNSWMMRIVSVGDSSQAKHKEKPAPGETPDRARETEAAAAKLHWLSNNLQAVYLIPEASSSGQE